jgi:hypothetical protein
MWKHSYYPYKLDNKITEETKLLIGIGDSFCAGRGACTIDLWEKHGWDYHRMYREGGNEVEFSNYTNSSINQLCKNYMPDWTPLNLGLAGKGNRFAIKELTMNQILGIERAKEKIVVFFVSGFERYDFANDLIGSDHFYTLWPVYHDEKVGYADIKVDNGESIYNEKFILSEFLLHMIELTNWCKLHNAKLLLISGFTPELNKSHFMEIFSPKVTTGIEQMKFDELIWSIPWNRIIRPMGFSCITDMLMHLEGWDEQSPYYGFRNMNIETMGPNGFMTKCHHPSEKAHKILAEIIYEHILKYDEGTSGDKKTRII